MSEADARGSQVQQCRLTARRSRDWRAKTSTFAKRPRNRKTAVPRGQWAQWPKQAAHICYEPHLSPEGKQHKHYLGRRYRVGGTTLISLPQAINFKAAVDFAASIGTPLTAHCIIHWVGTDAGDDPTGELFAEVRETVVTMAPLPRRSLRGRMVTREALRRSG